MLTFDKAFSPENVDEAVGYLYTKANTLGIDGVKLHNVAEHIKTHPVSDDIRNGRYIPAPAMAEQISKRSGGLRTIYKLGSVDRFIAKVVQIAVVRHFDYMFAPQCIGYRKSKGTADCVSIIREGLKNGLLFAVKLDISDFFGSIRHDKLLKQVDSLDVDEIIKRVIRIMIEYPVLNNFKV